MKKIIIFSLAFSIIGLSKAYGIDWEIIQQNLERWRQSLNAIQLSDPCNIIYERLVTMQECPAGETCHAFEVTLTTIEQVGSDTCHIEGSGEGRRLGMGTRDEQFRGVRSNGGVVLLGDADITNDDSSFSYDVTNTAEFNAFDHFELSHRPPFSPVRRLRISFSNFLVNGVENPITQVQQDEEEGGGGDEDPCDGVGCDEGEVCEEGACVAEAGGGGGGGGEADIACQRIFNCDGTETLCQETDSDCEAVADVALCNSIAEVTPECAPPDVGPRPPGQEVLRRIEEANLNNGATSPGGGACALNTQVAPSGFGLGLLMILILSLVTFRSFPRSIKR